MFLGGGNEHFCDWRFFVRFVGEKVFLFGTVAVGANFGLPRTLGFKSGPFVVLRARERERENDLQSRATTSPASERVDKESYLTLDSVDLMDGFGIVATMHGRVLSQLEPII